MCAIPADFVMCQHYMTLTALHVTPATVCSKMWFDRSCRCLCIAQMQQLSLQQQQQLSMVLFASQIAQKLRQEPQ